MNPLRPRFRPRLSSLEDRTVPSADFFADAEWLSGSQASVAGNNDAATAEPGEPAGEGTSGDINSVWWDWTAPVSGWAEINTFGSPLDTVLGVYTGPAVDDLTLVAANDDAMSSESQVRFLATAGTTYHIAVDGYASDTGDFFLQLGTTPENDDFANATVIAGSTATGTNLAATGETAEPVLPRTSGDLNSVWWSWTAATTGEVTADTIGSDFDTILSAFTGSSVDSLTAIAVNDDIDFPNTLVSSVVFQADAGTTYYFSVDGYMSRTGSIALNLSVAPAADTEPAIADQNFAVDENSAAGTVVGTVVASDSDAGQTLSYAIAGGDGAGRFAIDSDSGEITVASGASLDHESQSRYQIIVDVSDGGSHSATATMTISVNDVNESPVFAATGPLTVDENVAAGTAVGTVSATDPDAGQSLTYAITGGNASGAFAIDAAGNITIANAAAIDFETNPIFNLSVQATDSGTPALSAITTVIVQLCDVNDAPVLDSSGSMSLQTMGLLQVGNSGTLVSDLLASAGGDRITDQDAGAVEGIAIIAADTAHGSWEFSTNGGSTWTALAAVSSGSARLLAADANTRIRFVPALGYTGTINQAITFCAWDRSSGSNGGLASTLVSGGTTAFSTATETASITVRSLLGWLL